MRKVLTAAMFLGLTALPVLSAAPPVAAEEFSCIGTVGGRTLDNVRVPQGRSCTLDGTQVQGTVYVEEGASLTARGVRVNGNIQAGNHRSVVVNGNSFIGGSFEAEQGGAFRIVQTQVEGSIKAISNQGAGRIANNRVNADVQVFSNGGGVDVTRNRVDGNLQCKENEPAPTGGGNVVQGNKEDQCAGL